MVEVSTPYFGSTSEVWLVRGGRRAEAAEPVGGQDGGVVGELVGQPPSARELLAGQLLRRERATRSVRPTEPYSRLPPVNTAVVLAVGGDVGHVGRGVAGGVHRPDREGADLSSSPSDTPWKS
jgi:hypothetical protein